MHETCAKMSWVHMTRGKYRLTEFKQVFAQIFINSFPKTSLIHFLLTKWTLPLPLFRLPVLVNGCEWFSLAVHHILAIRRSSRIHGGNHGTNRGWRGHPPKLEYNYRIFVVLQPKACSFYLVIYVTIPLHNFFIDARFEIAEYYLRLCKIWLTEEDGILENYEETFLRLEQMGTPDVGSRRYSLWRMTPRENACITTQSWKLFRGHESETMLQLIAVWCNSA